MKTFSLTFAIINLGWGIQHVIEIGDMKDLSLFSMALMTVILMIQIGFGSFMLNMWIGLIRKDK